MGNQDDSGSSLPRYGWSGTNQQFGSSGGARTPTKTLYGNAGKAVVGAVTVAAGAAIIESSNVSPVPTYSGVNTTTIEGITALVGEAYIKKVQAANNPAGGGGGGGDGSGGGGGSDRDEIKLPKDRSEAELAQLFLMDIGGRELVNLTRHDQINGINQEYSPIKNLADISLQYNPFEISPNADNVTTYLTTFNFDITKYIPTQTELDEEYPVEADAAKRTVVYFDKSTNSLNVHVKNIFTNERVEVEFIIPEEVKDGTIYT